jgi:hypothetical protein
LENRDKVIKSNCEELEYKLELYDLQNDPTEKVNLASSGDMEPLLSKAKELFKSEHIPFKDSGMLF